MQYRIFLEKLALARNDQPVKVRVFNYMYETWEYVDVIEVQTTSDDIVMITSEGDDE